MQLPIIDTKPHAKYSPSSSERWIECSASVEYTESEEKVHDFAEFGTEIHAWIESGALVHPTTWTEEQSIDAETCHKEWIKHVPDDALREQWLQSKDWPDLFFGTIDAIKLEGTHGRIWDLKTGLRGVSVVDNTQLKSYALLAIDNYPQLESVETWIIQPRRYYIDSHVYTRAEIEAFRGEVRRAIESESSLKAGTHCEFCPARASCTTLHNTFPDLLSDLEVIGVWHEK